MCQSKTLKICANHLVVPSLSVQEHAGNDKLCVWHALDYADGEPKEELFCIRFASVENCKTFQNKIEEVAESQEPKSGENEVAGSAANLLEKLSIGSKDQEEKAKETPAEKKEGENVKQESQSRDEEEKTKEILLSAEKKEDENVNPKSISDEWVCV